MNLTNHELLLYTNDDYRENVLKGNNGPDEIKKLSEDSNE